jgi:voltage-gated potassium channel
VSTESETPDKSPRERAYEVIFEADTPLGKTFDVALLWCIVASIAVVMLESVAELQAKYGGLLYAIEWTVTVLFTLEYGLRLWCARGALRYATSFFGVVDLMSLLPTYLSLFVGGTQSLMVVRALRLLRVFRVLKLGRLTSEARVLRRALVQSREKISVFLAIVLILTVIAGSAMYLIEGPEHGFSSIPRGVYWAIVTMTTVGYGDIHPQTPLGQLFAATLMIMGYAIIAVPTGIVSVELAEATRRENALPKRVCSACAEAGHTADAHFCRLCGGAL